jgi:hypothetical protein
MSTETPEGDLSAELRELGRNLKNAAKTAWESDESRRLQQELKDGLAALEAGLRETSSELSSEETRQRVRNEAHDYSQRVRSGQVATQLRSDLLAALRAVNAEIKKATPPGSSSNDKA